MKVLFIVLLLFLPAALGVAEVTYSVSYSEAFHKHYPVRGRDFVLTHYALEVPTVMWTQFGQRKVTVFRTKGDEYPYEEQKCVIKVEGSGLETPRILSATHFRTVDVSWITEKLLLIRLGIGRIAVVEAIYDTDKDSWLYRESVQYIEKVEPADARNGGNAPDEERSP